MTREEKALQAFTDGANCAQAVVIAYADALGIDEKTAARLGSSFGGGIGRLREVCGAVSGMMMVYGLLKGYDDLKDSAAKKAHYANVQALAAKFREENGSIVCRELLKGVETTSGGVPEPRTEEYYKKRPCPALAACAAGILDEMLGISPSHIR